MMSANSNKILHVDAGHCPVCDTEDLDYFQRILDDIVDEYSLGLLPVNDKEYLKAQLAVAIFKSAEAGDRDYARLKRSAIEAVSAVPSSDPGS
jgi:hypothetical protein